MFLLPCIIISSVVFRVLIMFWTSKKKRETLRNDFFPQLFLPRGHSPQDSVLLFCTPRQSLFLFANLWEDSRRFFFCLWFMCTLVRNFFPFNWCLRCIQPLSLSQFDILDCIDRTIVNLDLLFELLAPLNAFGAKVFTLFTADENCKASQRFQMYEECKIQGATVKILLLFSAFWETCKLMNFAHPQLSRPT